MTILTIRVLVVLSLTLPYRGRGYWAWLIPGGPAVVFGVPAGLVSRWVIRLMKLLLPRIGETERIALDAGTV